MDDYSLLLTLIAVGCVAGVFAGLLGIGGGLITTPVLLTLFQSLGVDPAWQIHMAVATSLVIVIATSLSSARAHYKAGHIDWDRVKVWAPTLLVGSVLGSRFAQMLDGVWLAYGFIAFALTMALKMILPLDRYHIAGDPVGLMTGRVIPGAIGFLSAILGIGGGSLSVPYMTVFGIDIKRAVGTSAFFGVLISLAGGAGYLIETENPSGLAPDTFGLVHWPSALLMAATTIFTAPLGAKLAGRLPKRLLSSLFGIFLIIAVIRISSAL